MCLAITAQTGPEVKVLTSSPRVNHGSGLLGGAEVYSHQTTKMPRLKNMKIMVNGVTILSLPKRTSSKSVLCGHAKDSLIDLPHTYDLGYIEHYYKKHYWAP